jgi:hypothetical protein
VYILKKSGLPLLAGCTGSEYCQAHMSQPELRSGLMSAMFTFSKESFKESNMEQILFDDVKISFYTELDSEILIVFVNDRRFKDKKIYSQLKKTWNRFHSRFKYYLNSHLIDTDEFQSFHHDLRQLGVSPPSPLFDTREMQKEKEEYSSNDPNLFTWLKNKIQENFL